MGYCNLEYIPKRLHNRDDLQLISHFYLKDILYRRIKKDIKDNPYGKVSLSDLSHNIGINNSIELSKSKDVLFSTIDNSEFQIYEDHLPIKLEIISLNTNNQYDKIFRCKKNSELKVRCFLKHDPVACMYPHCVFQYYVYNEEEEIEVTFDNYKKTLGHKRYKYLRAALRQELALMIVRQSISFEERI